MKNIFWLACGAFLAGGVVRADVELPIQENLWKRQYFSEIGAPRSDETAKVTIENGLELGWKDGNVLSIGPWRVGDYSLRYDWHQSIPLKGPVTVRGTFRVENLLPGQAEVVVQWMKAGKRLRRDTYDLPEAGNWTKFAIPLRRVPIGADAIIPGFGLGEKTRVGRVLFAGLKLTDGVEPLEFPAEAGAITRNAPPAELLPPPPPAPEPPAPDAPADAAPDALPDLPHVAVPHFRVQKAGDTWWLVTPENKPFFSLGTDAPPFEKDAIDKGRAYDAQLRNLGFNSLAGWTNIWRWSALNDALQTEGKKPLTAFVTLQSSNLEGNFDVLQTAKGDAKKSEHAFPDPFDPRFEIAYRTEALKIATLVKDKPWLVGYFADNEIAHRDLPTRLWSPHCAEALRDWLKEKYESIEKLNAAWNTKFTSFDDIIAKKPLPTSENMETDFLLFARQVVQKYISITIEAWRDVDPDHLVFSNRFMLDEFTDLMPYLDMYSFYDGIGVNLYPANNEAGLNNLEKQRLQMLHQFTRKPLIISEWSIPARDSGLYDKGDKLDWSWAQTVGTQSERANQSARVLTDFYNLPFVIGAHWFTWQDFDSEKRQANRGLIKANGEAWSELQNALTVANKRLPAAQN